MSARFEFYFRGHAIPLDGIDLRTAEGVIAAERRRGIWPLASTRPRFAKRLARRIRMARKRRRGYA